MTPRKGFTPLQRLKIFEANGGRCHICSRKIQIGERWDVEHKRPRALLGSDDADNLAPAHLECHAEKTATDLGTIAKVKRIRAAHIGARKPRGWPSKYRKKMNGEVVLR